MVRAYSYVPFAWILAKYLSSLIIFFHHAPTTQHNDSLRDILVGNQLIRVADVDNARAGQEL